MGAPHPAGMFHPRRAARYRRLLATLSADEIGDAIEALIARLDLLAGDPDLEDDDPAGDPLDRGEGDTFEGAGGGSGFDARFDGARPRYSLDQTRGPSNIAEATREHQARELGLVRTSIGGWRFPERAR